MLTPQIEDWYDKTYRSVSLCFLAPAAGYMVSAFCNNYVHSLVGLWGTSIFAMSLLTLGYAVIVWTPPFPLLVLAYALTGLGNGTLDAAWNVYISNLRNENELLGLMHGFYGLGAVTSPLVATAMVTAGMRWNYYYIILFGLGCMMIVLSAVVFRGETAKKYLAQSKASTAVESTGDDEAISADLSTAEESHLALALRSRNTLLAALFLFAYMGAEVGLGSWIVTFMVRERGGAPARMGAVASGFWVGLLIGRVALGFVTGRLGENTMVKVYLLLAFIAELVFWKAPSILGSAIGVSLVGVMFGPLFPTLMVALTKTLPRKVHVAAIGFVAACGGLGSAIFPFITGAMAETQGPWVLQPLVLALIAVMFVVWLYVPSFEKPRP
ncbi:major facilitator superfamily domain-containing protein [Limtongia smithiae]|uniref:major facilitator superfamily domain-containing protein n=1 Tax=Limtongia smithiae TaxID=1125753 RepID=UPI0034CE9AA5